MWILQNIHRISQSGFQPIFQWKNSYRFWHAIFDSYYLYSGSECETWMHQTSSSMHQANIIAHYATSLLVACQGGNNSLSWAFGLVVPVCAGGVICDPNNFSVRDLEWKEWGVTCGVRGASSPRPPTIRESSDRERRWHTVKEQNQPLIKY